MPDALGTMGGSSGAGWSSLAARRAHNPKVVGSNPTPATNSNLLICKSFIYLGQSGPIEACSDVAIPTENYPVASEHGAYLLALRGRMVAIGHVFA